jgi:hypothetical protein
MKIWLVRHPGRISLILAVLSLLLAQVPSAQAQCDTVYQWQQWEKSINTGAASLGADPYRDYIIRATFSNPSWGSFTQDAFWDNDPANPNIFKIRTALPAGTTPGTSATWNWSGITCTTTSGAACPAITWSQTSGCITVQPQTTTGIKIYDQGFLKQDSVVMVATRLVYWDESNFFWLGDTAWAAPPREIKPQTSQWPTYLQQRAGKFTVIQIAPAVTWQPMHGEFTPLPAASGFSFDQSLCVSGNPIPNQCTRPIKSYWDQFDNLIAQANAKDLVVFIAGLIDPTDAGSATIRYPAVQDAKSFARYLAARTAGRAVILSPGFDDRISSLTADGQSLSTAMEQVGQAIKAASPRALATNHLAGASLCSDYQSFQYEGTWMTFFAYQSGHGNGTGSPAGTLCGGPYPQETALLTAMRRSFQVPSTLGSCGTLFPCMLGYNAEGPYDTYPPPSPQDPVDNRYRVRQVAYNSAFTNALGYTYGVVGLGLWNNPALSTFQAPSATDMTYYRQIAQLQAAGQGPFSNWILNQQANWDKKMVLATDQSSIVLAYLPGDTQNNGITISTSYLPGLGCTWTSTWIDPVTNGQRPAACSSGSGTIRFNKPSCDAQNTDCDWVLQLKKGAGAPASGALLPASQRIDLRADFNPGDGTSSINALVTDSGNPSPVPATPTVLSPAGQISQENPQVIAVSNGYLALWQANRLDGSLLGVFARQIDWHGQPVGPRFQVNLTSEENQRDPVAASDGQGHAVIVWSSYGQDGDRGGIFGRLVDTTGLPAEARASTVRMGDLEISINVTAIGHQEKPQALYLSPDRFVVAWQTRADSESHGFVSARLFDASGHPLGGEVTIPGEESKQIWLVTLAAGASGGFGLYWTLHDPTLATRNLFRQSFDSTGTAMGTTTLILQEATQP